MKKANREPELARALPPVPTFERAVREVSKMFREASIRHALVGALGANAYRTRPRTTEDIVFLVGSEAFRPIPVASSPCASPSSSSTESTSTRCRFRKPWPPS